MAFHSTAAGLSTPPCSINFRDPFASAALNESTVWKLVDVVQFASIARAQDVSRSPSALSVSVWAFCQVVCSEDEDDVVFRSMITWTPASLSLRIALMTAVNGPISSTIWDTVDTWFYNKQTSTGRSGHCNPPLVNHPSLTKKTEKIGLCYWAIFDYYFRCWQPCWFFISISASKFTFHFTRVLQYCIKKTLSQDLKRTLCKIAKKIKLLPVFESPFWLILCSVADNSQNTMTRQYTTEYRRNQR